MAREGARITDLRRISVLENFPDYHQTLTTVTGAALATAIPATNLSGRNGVFVQNLTDSDLYIGGCRPQLLAWSEGFENTISATKKTLIWTDSPNKTGEYYASKPDGTTPGLETPLIAYAVLSKGGGETLLTAGIIGSLNDHEWVWGDSDGLGNPTVYFKDATGDPDGNSWFSFMSYWRIPSASAFGWHLGRYDGKFITCDGSVRLFAYSATTSSVITLEV